MIANVSISPAALAPIAPTASSAEKAVRKKSLRALARSLVEHGCLVAASKEDADALILAARELEQTAPGPAKVWQEALIELKQGRRFGISSPNRSPVSEIRELKTLREEWRSTARVVVIDDGRAEDMGVHDCDAKGRPEISPVLVARDSTTFNSLEKLAFAGVWGTSKGRDDFWNRVLRPLALRSDRIEICDRYMLREMVLAREGARRSEEADALAWLLSKIDAEGRPGTTVQIFTSLNLKVSISRTDSIQSPGTNEAVLELINDFIEVGGGAIDRIEPHACYWDSMPPSDRPHDRHISFSTGADIGLERGLDSFDSEEIKSSSGIAWSYGRSQEIKAKNEQERRAILAASRRSAA